MTLPEALDKELITSWVLFKKSYRQGDGEVNAGTKSKHSAEGTEEEPRFCGDPGWSIPPLKPTLGRENLSRSSPLKASLLASVCF